MPSATRVPATDASAPLPGDVLGIDGCPAGWIAVGVAPCEGCGGSGTPEGVSLRWAVGPALASLVADASLAIIDMPIGLSDGPPRPCDRAARRLLGPRRASVFTPPMRGMLGLPDRASATRYGQARRSGGGVSAQAWNIVPKIREADAVVTPDRQNRLREGHPEVAFARLNGAPLAHAKRTAAGARVRRALLLRAGLDADALLRSVRAVWTRSRVADDDVLDAAVLALTARAVIAGRAIRLGGEADATGRIMEILG